MKKNKKAIGRLIVFAILFSMIILTFMFRLIFLKEGGDQFLIDPLTEVGIGILNTTGNDASVDTLLTVKSVYDTEINVPYDLFFAIILILSVGFTFFSAFKARKLSAFSFYGMLFFGSFLILLAIGFIEQLTTWFLDNFYNVLFSDVGLDTPIMDWFFENMSLITYLWAMIIIVINRFDIKETTQAGRIEE